MRRLYDQDIDEQELKALERFRRCVRRGNVREAREWLQLAERFVRLKKNMCDMIMASEAHDDRQIANAYRQADLAKRATSAR